MQEELVILGLPKNLLVGVVDLDKVQNTET